MNENTNIVTVRRLNDGSSIVSVNGHEVPFVTAIANASNHVSLHFDVAQFNDIKEADATEAHFTPNTANPRADQYLAELRTARSEYYKLLVELRQIEAAALDAKWYERGLAKRILGVMK